MRAACLTPRKGEDTKPNVFSFFLQGGNVFFGDLFSFLESRTPLEKA